MNSCFRAAGAAICFATTTLVPWTAAVAAADSAPAATATPAVAKTEPLPVFNAVLTMGKESRFVLIAPGGKASEWITLGAEYSGYTLKNFDAATSTLEVEKDGVVTKLPLATAVIVDAATAPHGTAATIADAERLLETMQFESMMGKLLDQQKKQALGMVRQMMSRMATGASKEDAIKFQEKMIETMMAALKPDELKQDMAQIYTDVFTKEELDAQAAFYQSPEGRAVLDKTPEVQSRLQAVMMPRIQAAMPKVMQLAQQFRAEEQAKAEAAKATEQAPADPKG